MKSIIVDGHCDTLQMAYDEGLSIFDKKYSFNIKEAKCILPYIQFLSCFINTKYDFDNNGFSRINAMLDKFYLEYENNKEHINLIKSKSDIKNNLNKVGIVLTIENGIALGNNIYNIRRLYNRGIRVMSLTWNDDNFLACGSHTKNDVGLTKEGIKCIKLMNELGIIIDVSHLSQKSFYDICSITNKCIIATHSCVDSICKNKRNLTDNQIKIIAQNKGIIGVCFYKYFLSNNKNVSIDDIINHIEYISNLVGTEYVGIGSDFDGMDKSDIPVGLSGIKDMRNIAEKLNDRGFNKNEIYNIMGGNYIRVLKENLN